MAAFLVKIVSIHHRIDLQHNIMLFTLSTQASNRLEVIASTAPDLVFCCSSKMSQ